MATHDLFGPITLSDDGRYLIVQELDLPQVQELRAMLAKVVAVGKRSNVWRVLFDARAMNTQFGLANAFWFGEVFAQTVPPAFRVAMLVAYEFPNRRFLETVAVNRGAQMHYFTDYDQALAWLLN